MMTGKGPAPSCGKYTSVARRTPSRMATIWVDMGTRMLFSVVRDPAMRPVP